MAAEKGKYPVKMMAELLGVSVSGFYSWLKRAPGQDPWAGLRGAVLAVRDTSARRFGARKVRACLPDEFDGATLYRVRKCMRELGIRGVCPNKRKRTTIPGEGAPARPGLVRRDFTSPVPTHRLVGGITYLRATSGFIYLATVIDLCTRMVVGWSISERMTADIVVSALEMAWGARLRRGGRDLPLGPGQPVHGRDAREVGEGARRSPVRRKDGLVPRQRRGIIRRMTLSARPGEATGGARAGARNVRIITFL